MRQRKLLGASVRQKKAMSFVTTRNALAVLVLASVAIVVAANRDIRSQAARPENVMLIYVGAENCGPCKVWQRTDGAAFRDSAEFPRLSYREVKSPTLLDVLKDQNWPDDLIAYRQTIDPRAGVPLWLIIADGQPVMQGFGLSQWREAVRPKLRTLLR